MKIRILAAALFCLLILFGCQKEPAEVKYQEVWEHMPELNYGVLEYEPLEVLPWYAGRCEATADLTWGHPIWAETELGFYTLLDSRLYYADKANMGNWVVVCNQPDCKHSSEWRYGDPVCNAGVASNSFLMVNGRLLSEESSYKYSQFRLEQGECTILLGRGPDGTDWRREYYAENTVMTTEGVSRSSILNYEYWLQLLTIPNADGSFTAKLFCTTKDGDFLLTEKQLEYSLSQIVMPGVYAEVEVDGQTALMLKNPKGDKIFSTTLFDDALTVAYRIRDGKLETPDIMAYADQWEYLSGDILRLHREGEGIYDVNLLTGEEVKVTDDRGGYISVYLPNCITSVWRDEDGYHMELFDGQKWRTVAVPEEARDVSFTVQCIASDRILLRSTDAYTVYDDRQNHIWQIMLDREELEIEYCGPIGYKEEK